MKSQCEERKGQPRGNNSLKSLRTQKGVKGIANSKVTLRSKKHFEAAWDNVKSILGKNSSSKKSLQEKSPYKDAMNKVN